VPPATEQEFGGQGTIPDQKGRLIMTTPFQRFRKLYGASALIVFNTMLMLALVYAGLAGLFHFRDQWKARPENNPVTRKYGTERILRAYPGSEIEQINQLLHEHWTRPVEYQPFTQFREPAFSGRYLNVHPAGFREIPEQAPWPPLPDRLNIFLFGGSTTFGYGVPDDQTIAAFLQTALSAEGADAAVYNFAQGGYYSSQEITLFQRLLAQGIKPGYAIFIDGLNEFYYDEDAPLQTDRLRTIVNSQYTRGFETQNPLMRMIKNLQRYAAAVEDPPALTEPTPEETRMRVAEAVERYIHNIRQASAVAEEYGIPTLFVWQPVPNYRYDLSLHPFSGFGFEEQGPTAEGYEYFADHRDEVELPPSFLWLADMQENAEQNFYVDQIHYNPVLSRMIAEELAAQIFIEP
jgi:hypothetical protein